MKKGFLMVGAVLAVLLAGVGGFWGGVTYQTNQANQIRDRFAAARGLEGGGQFAGRLDGQPSGQAFAGNGQAAGFVRGGTVGQVKGVDGNVLTLSTAQEVVTVHLSASTQIEKMAAVTVDDLQPGVRIMVTGQADEAGEINASLIQVVDGSLPGLDTPPSPTGTVP